MSKIKVGIRISPVKDGEKDVCVVKNRYTINCDANEFHVSWRFSKNLYI